MIIAFVIPFGSITSWHPRKAHKCLAFNLEKQKTYQLKEEDFEGKDNYDLGKEICQKFYDNDKNHYLNKRTQIKKFINSLKVKYNHIKDDIYVDSAQFVNTYEYINVIGDMVLYDFAVDSKILNKITKLINLCASIGIYCKPAGLDPKIANLLGKKMKRDNAYILDLRNPYFMKQTKNLDSHESKEKSNG